MPTQKKTLKPIKKSLVPLVVTTLPKGIFFGYGIPTTESTIRLEKARMIHYWPSEVKGVLGLAATGPTANCRVGLAVPAITLREITAIMEVSPAATEAWEKGPWKA